MTAPSKPRPFPLVPAAVGAAVCSVLVLAVLLLPVDGWARSLADRYEAPGLHSTDPVTDLLSEADPFGRA